MLTISKRGWNTIFMDLMCSIDITGKKIYEQKWLDQESTGTENRRKKIIRAVLQAHGNTKKSNRTGTDDT